MIVGTEPRVTYYVGEKTAEGLDVRDLHSGGSENRSSVEAVVIMFNEDEAERAQIEQRPVRTQFVAVEATTTFEEASLGGPSMEPEQYDRRRMATILCAHLHGSGHHPTFCEQAWDAVVKMTTPEGGGS